MNQSQFRKATDISAELAACWFPHIVVAMKEFDITAAIDQVMFIAQVGHENMGFTQLVESFNYNMAGLSSFAHAGRPVQGRANSLGRRRGESSLPPERQRAIANLVHSKCMGNNGPTDGWFCRGHGLIQITGLNSYRDCGNALKIDLVKKPELSAQDEYAARNATWFYASRGCLRYPDNLTHVMQVINGGQNGIDDRRARFLEAKTILVVRSWGPKLSRGWWLSSWMLSLTHSASVMLAEQVRRKPKPINSVPERTPPPPSPRQNVRRKL